MAPTVPSAPNAPAGPHLRAVRRAALWAALLVFLTDGYFRSTRPGWNVGARFDLTCALAERGTFKIDDYQSVGWPVKWMTTNDTAFFQGHFYSDKSPVTSFLGVPVVWVYRWMNRHLGVFFRYEYALWAVTWIVVGGAAGALAAELTFLFTRRGLSPARAAAGGVFWIGATPLLGYSVVYYDYLPACALLIGAFLVAEPAWRDPGGVSERRMFYAGILGGLAVWTLNTVGIAAITMTLLIAIGPPGKPSFRAMMRRIWPWALGGAIGASGNFIYNHALFGSFRPAYTYEYDATFREHMSHGLMGAGWPRPFVIWLQTFHRYQGLFRWFPATAAATLGCLWLIFKSPGYRRRESAIALSTFMLFLLYISGYYMWWGGYSGYAPRHLIPALPFLALGLAPWLAKHRRLEPWIWILAAAAAIFNLAAVAVTPQYQPGLSEEALMHPELVIDWPSPMMAMQHDFWINGITDSNWGRLFGLKMQAEYVPVVLLWIAGFLVLPRWLRAEKADDAESDPREAGS